jgi:hypothetical protein
MAGLNSSFLVITSLLVKRADREQVAGVQISFRRETSRGVMGGPMPIPFPLPLLHLITSRFKRPRL